MTNEYRTQPVPRAVMVSDFGRERDNAPSRQSYHAYPHMAPERHASHDAHDVTSVLGLPSEQVTPELLAALEPLLTELDGLRHQVERDTRRISVLAHQAERHCVVPALNRRAFMRELDAFLANEGHAGAVVMLHLGGVERLRLAHGMAAGEGALRHACAAALSVLRGTDVVALLGGSDFALLLPNCGEADARERLAAIARKIDDPAFTWMGQPVVLTARCGIHALQAGESAEQAVAAADRERRGI
ncbi:MAG TPA: diguanylate cyclase [Candidatus Omnitrophota bacterium]|nr:diguanylate cyclase [Candidatus Omnitrophota bacterium]